MGISLNILIGCEYSFTIAAEFRKLGHNAWSCDFEDTEGDSRFHLKMDILKAINVMNWDLLIVHPPCTFLANSGIKHLFIEGKKKNGIDEIRWKQMEDAALFFTKFFDCSIACIAIENPILHKYAMRIIKKKYTQVIQPWQHGHNESKSTCLWLKGLPKLKATNIVDNQGSRIHKKSALNGPGTSKNRQKERARTYPGIAQAMANQWSDFLLNGFEKAKAGGAILNYVQTEINFNTKYERSTCN